MNLVVDRQDLQTSSISQVPLVPEAWARGLPMQAGNTGRQVAPSSQALGWPKRVLLQTAIEMASSEHCVRMCIHARACLCVQLGRSSPETPDPI